MARGGHGEAVETTGLEPIFEPELAQPRPAAHHRRVGDEVTVEQACEAARATGLSILASLKQELGELDSVTGWVKALGFVNCGEGFNVTPAAINGFSDLILELWGDAGRHARSAIGAGELPVGMPVEVEAVVTVG